MSHLKPNGKPDAPRTSASRYNIIGVKNGCREHYTTEPDRETAEEEAERLTDSDPEIDYHVEAEL